MSKLRDEVRGAFAREQAELGDVRDARQRLMQNALTIPVRESHRLQWVAAVAAVLIAAIVLATFAIARINTRSQAVPAATPSPKAQASPTPLTNVLNIPDSTPIVIYSDPAKPGQLDGVTWDGKTSGKLAHQQPGSALGNPQNNLFATGNSIVDRSGKTVMTGTFGAKYWQATWADDGRHFCEMVPFDNPGDSGLPTALQLVTVGAGTRDIAKIGTLNQQTFVRVASCSVLADRAVVVQSGGQGIGTAQVWVVQLSTGKTLWTRTYDTTTTNVTLVPSRDGMYVAENAMNSGSSTIYGPDGRAITHLTSQVEAFSWDDSLAVTDPGYGSTPVDVISWRVGTVLWSCPPGTALLQALPQPGGTELAIWVAPTAEFQQQTQSPDLFVLGADGSVVFHVARQGGA